MLSLVTVIGVESDGHNILKGFTFLFIYINHLTE